MSQDTARSTFKVLSHVISFIKGHVLKSTDDKLFFGQIEWSE